ncbi:Cdc6/Cdc18 family protein [Haloarcula argentinensis]|uniref:Orc / cell division control protein 6 n=1 Tax=Haloarcula argentinensis TaxID=43776 RepID=A0A830FWN8_HALAR|nr:AAA family ATPase [Haloarcula argentinensis]GGM53196.1 orc / cell division control protein 6 [Haloarcula argentinensis]
MITDRSVFRDDWLPDVQHREAEMTVLTDALAPVLDGDRAEDVLLHGPQGVGKTVLTRAALDRLDRQQPTPSAHVRCLGASTAGIVRAILRELPGSDPARTTPRDELIATLQERVTEPTVVVLDEGDDLPETDILDVLRRVPDISWIAICHDEIDWLSRVDESIRHGLNDRSLQLDKFSTGELTDILDARQRVGLESGVISRGQLRTLADDAAGVARRGIFALRAAAELATERSHSTIEDIDVQDSFDRARRQLREQALESLPFHHHVLYEIIRRKGRIRTAAVNDRYDAIAAVAYDGRDQTPISKRERRTKLTKLVAYDLLGCEGEGPGREYWPCDASVSSPLDLTVPVP